MFWFCRTHRGRAGYVPCGHGRVLYASLDSIAASDCNQSSKRWKTASTELIRLCEGETGDGWVYFMWQVDEQEHENRNTGEIVT